MGNPYQQKQYKTCLNCGKFFYKRGTTPKYCSHHCATSCTNRIFKYPFGPSKYRYYNGYTYIYVPNHPYCDKKGYYPEHRFIMEQHLGYVLPKMTNGFFKDAVHHINLDKSDNRLSNLQLMPRGDHIKLHAHYRRLLKQAPHVNQDDLHILQLLQDQ